MKVAVGLLAEKVTVGTRASKVTETASGGGDGEADVDGLTDGEGDDDKSFAFLSYTSMMATWPRKSNLFR